jgi:hypothetical protein
MLVPAGDWRGIDPRHSQIASFRAIEQGFNLVRQGNRGLSAAYDYEGHVMARMDHYQAERADDGEPDSDPGRMDAVFQARRLAGIPLHRNPVLARDSRDA